MTAGDAEYGWRLLATIHVGFSDVSVEAGSIWRPHGNDAYIFLRARSGREGVDSFSRSIRFSSPGHAGRDRPQADARTPHGFRCCGGQVAAPLGAPGRGEISCRYQPGGHFDADWRAGNAFPSLALQLPRRIDYQAAADGGRVLAGRSTHGVYSSHAGGLGLHSAALREAY